MSGALTAGHGSLLARVVIAVDAWQHCTAGRLAVKLAFSVPLKAPSCLHSRARSEERHCRFCNQELPDWRPALTPSALQPKPSVMSVRYKGVTHRIQYTPGPDGLEHFLSSLQRVGIKVASASQVTFLCRSPDTGEEMALRGLSAFDAAAYCASITAATSLHSR